MLATKLLVIDEIRQFVVMLYLFNFGRSFLIYMASASTLSALEEVFRRNLNQRTLEFGGISVVLCGDLTRLPPIMNKVIYRQNQRSISGLRSFEMYCNMARFNAVILNFIKGVRIPSIRNYSRKYVMLYFLIK